jgi:TonB-dependent receptor
LASLASAARAQAPPPDAATGIIAGTVVDKGSGDPLIDAGVEVIGQKSSARTDLDGKFTLRLPPGTYELRIFAPGFVGLRVQGVVVKPGRAAKADATLTPAGQGNVETVEVVAQANRASETAQLLKRQRSPVVSDTISAEAIAKSPDSNAADVVERTPSVTTKDNFVFVRGLGPRYTIARLNESRLPSTDPQKRVIPLDLFPATFLESVDVLKSYTPDLPGDFTGGLVDIYLREFPEQLSFATSMGTGGNTETTFQRFKTYRGSSLDYLGLGSTFRNLPSGFPGTKSFITLTPDEADAAARSLKNIWDVQNETAPLNTNVSLSVGDSVGPWGFDLAGIYTTEYKHENKQVAQYVNANNVSNPVPTQVADFNFDDDRFETRLGGILTSSYKLGDNDKLSFRALVNHSTTDQVLDGKGMAAATPGQILAETRLRYTEDELDFGQLAGEHHWNWISVDWRSAFGRTTEQEPDTRSLTYEGPPGEPPVFVNESQGGLRVFNDLQELLTDSAIDFTVPFKTALPATDFWSGLPGKLKFGPAYSYQDRDFGQRRFRYLVNGAALDRTLPPEELLAPNNLVPGVVDFVEQTLPKDQFHAIQQVGGGYGMLELPLIRDRLRVDGGARAEYSEIVLRTVNDANQTVRITKKNTDVLPGVNLVYSPRADMNVRFGYFGSVSRPEFRELSPVEYPTPRGLRATIGNPNLIEAHITSYDLRYEWFFSPLELLSFGGFYKEFTDPIEQTVKAISSDQAISFANAQDATLKGMEFELRKDFGFISPRLKYLSFLTNVAYTDSTAHIKRAKLDVQTATTRALQGQAPYVVNAVLDFTHPDWGTWRLLYNAVGEQIDAAGSYGLPDITRSARNELDAVILFPLKRFGFPKLTAKLAAENLLQDGEAFQQGGLPTETFNTGIKVNIGISYLY